jgi:hypothetical protein|tara:strand:+ start:4095 stop:9830 length:5736 start_codon:yes stop_codon:yes gene_type:complete
MAVINLFDKQEETSRTSQASNRVGVVNLFDSQPTATTTGKKTPTKKTFTKRRLPRATQKVKVKSVSKKPAPKKQSIFDKSFNFVKGLNVKKLGESIQGGAKVLPGQLKQASGIIMQGFVSQQKMLDSFYTKSPAVLKAALSTSPFFTRSVTKTFQPEKARKEEEEVLSTAKGLRESGVKVAQKAKKEHFEKFEPSTGIQGYLEMAAFNLPQIATTVGLSLATAIVTKNPLLAGSVGVSTGYGLGASEVYDEAREFGLSDSEALPMAQYGGAIIGAIDFLPIGRLVRKTGAIEPIKKSIIKKISSAIVSTGAQSGLEGLTESAQEIVANAISSTYNENADLFRGVKESAVVGALLGGFADVTVSGVVGVLNKKSQPKEVIEKIEKEIQNAVGTKPSKRTDKQNQIIEALFTNDLTPDEVAGFVLENDLDNTSEGKEIMQVYLKAKDQDKNIRLSLADNEKSINARLVDRSERIIERAEPEVVKTKAKPKAKPKKIPKKAIPKELEPLAQEARNYKSADEFVKAQRTPATADNADFMVDTDLFKFARDNPIEDAKVEKFVEDMGGDWGDFPPVSARKIIIDTDDFTEYVEAVEGGFEQELGWSRPLTEDDIGKEVADMEDGMHRVFAARKIGIQAPAIDMDMQEKVGRMSVSQLKEFYNQATAKKNIKTHITRKSDKKEQGKPISRSREKGQKSIKLKKPVKQKEKVLTQKARIDLQKEVGEVIASGDTQNATVRNIDSYIKNLFNQADDPLYIKKLRATKAELKRAMYDLTGANTGNWKRDYAFFQSVRDDPAIAPVIDRIEEGVFEIDDIVGGKAPVTSGYATTTAEKIDRFELRTKPQKGTEEFKLFNKTKALIKKYAQSIGEGYVPRNALGIYFPKTKNIRVNAINDLSVVAHEITHFLDATYKISDKLLALKGYAVNGNPIYDPKTLKYRKAITDLYTKYYAGGNKNHTLRKRTLEGFATLLQKYVETPARITKEYPLLVNDFLKKGGRYHHPVMTEIITDLNEIVKDYQGLSSLDKIGSRVTSDHPNIDKESFLSFRDKLRTQLVDEIYPVEVLAKKSKTFFSVKDPSLWLRAYNNVNGVVANNINSKRGYWTLVGDELQKTQDFNWKSLIDLTAERKNTDDFASYLVARREYFAYQEHNELRQELDKMENKIKSTRKEERAKLVDDEGQSLEEKFKEAEGTYKELGSILAEDGFNREEVQKAYLDNRARFVREEKMFDKLTREDLKLLNNENVQLIRKDQLTSLTSKKGYASFKRQFYDEIVGENQEFPRQIKVGKTKISSMLKRRGSQRTIINPLLSAMENHNEIMKKGFKQIVYNKVSDIGISAMFPNLFQEVDLKVSIDEKTGVRTYPQEKDPNIIMGRKDYKRQPVLVDGQLKGVIDDILTYENVDTFIKLYTGLSRLFTAGTTGYYPSFAATNLLRDQITAQANTANKYKTLYSPIKQLGELIKNRKGEDYQYYQEYMVLGGERQTFTGWQKLPAKKVFEAITNEKKGLQFGIKLMEKGTDVLAAPSKYSEIITRVTEYINARKAGKPQIVALEEAGRLTAPFHHIGKWGGRYGQVGIRGLPFFNAILQVIDQHARTMQRPSGRRQMAFVMLATTAAYITAMTQLMRASKEQKEQYRDLKPEELASFVHIPHPSGRKLIRIPMSEIFTPLGVVINMVIADRVLKTGYKGSDYMKGATAIIPDQFDILEPKKAFFAWIPQVFQAGTEVAMGVKTWPDVAPLESLALSTLPPKFRVNENTSVFAKYLGNKINQSPIKIDYLITGYFGRATGLVTGKPSAWDFDSSIIRDYWFSNGRRVSGAYDLIEKNNQEYNAHQRGIEKYDKKKIAEIYRIKMISNEFVGVMQDFRKVDIEKQQEKAANIRNEALILINQMESKKKPDGYIKWVRDANRRRDKKIKDSKSS